jgi:hypothetical protein
VADPALEDTDDSEIWIIMDGSKAGVFKDSNISLGDFLSDSPENFS